MGILVLERVFPTSTQLGAEKFQREGMITPWEKEKAWPSWPSTDLWKPQPDLMGQHGMSKLETNKPITLVYLYICIHIYLSMYVHK